MTGDMTEAQVGQLCDTFAKLSPAAQRDVFSRLLGEKAAINLFTARGDTFAESLRMLTEADTEHPCK
jgi:hypothetical protein